MEEERLVEDLSPAFPWKPASIASLGLGICTRPARSHDTMAPSSGRSVAETVTTRNCNVTRRSEPRVPTYDYDIAMLSDFRYPGGTSVSLAEEIKAQVSAGYTTVLVPAKAPHLARRRPFNPRLVEIIQGGLATLAPPDADLRVRLLIA